MATIPARFKGVEDGFVKVVFAAVVVLSGGLDFCPGSIALAANPPVFVQKKENQISSGTSVSAGFNAATTAGNAIVAYVIWSNTGSVVLTDSRNDTFVSAGGPLSWNTAYRAQIFYATNIAGGANTVKATFSNSVASFGVLYVHEYAGISTVNPIDIMASASGSSGSPNSGTATTTSANDLIFGAGVSSNTMTAAGPGFSARSYAFGNITEDKIAVSPASYNATATHNGNRWGMQMVAFRAAQGVQDITPPSLPAGLSGTAVSPSQINLSWASSSDPDNTSSQLTYACYRNGVLVGTTPAGTTVYSDTGLTAATTYTYTVIARDPAGNSSAPSAGIQVTTLPPPVPVITSFNATPAAITSGQTATLSWTVSGATSLSIDKGVGTVTGTSSIAVHPGVTTVYTLTATNSLGSTTAQKSLTVTPDTAAPTAPTGLTAVGTSVSQINLNWIGSSDNVSVSGYRIYRGGSQIATTSAVGFSNTGLSAGTSYTYAVAAFDAAGNLSLQSLPVSAATLAADSVAPTVSITSPSNGNILSGPVTIMASAADNVGVAGVQFKLDGANLGAEDTVAPYSIPWNTAAVAAGAHVLTAVARDAAGNQTTSSATNVTVDNIAPTVSMSAPASGSTVAGSTVMVSALASDNVAILEVQFKVDGAILGVDTTSPYSLVWNTTTFADGAHTMTAVAVDTAGMQTTSSSRVVTVDNSLPSVSITAPLNGASVTQSSVVAVSVTASDNSAVSGVQFQLDGLNLGAEDTASPYSMSWNTTTAAIGGHVLTAVARDAAGNTTTSAGVSITVSAPPPPDTTAPAVSITSPSNGAALSGSVVISASATDNVGVVGVQFYLDGGTLGQERTVAPYSTTWNTFQASNASHLIVAVARDAAGNVTTSSGVTVSVSNLTLRPYSTNFSLNENPISENNNWINGKATGLDWTNVRTSQGLAFGTETGSNGFDDSVALLSGAWGADQTVEATVHSVNQTLASFEEVELWLRGSITPHSIRGYEINFRCTGTLGDGYMQIVRWNGPLSNFTYLDFTGNGANGVRNGDVVKANITGNTITVWLNGVQIGRVTDNTYSVGNPGMGFFLLGAPGVDGDYGFSSFTATDGLSNDGTPPSIPTNLSAVGVSASQINLSWTASTDNVAVAGYRIFRDSIQLGTTTGTTFSDTGLNANTQYTYSVAAFDAAGNVSVPSLPVVGVTQSPDTTPPSAPVGLQSSNVTSNSARISWSASSDNVGVAGYQVFRNGNQVATVTSLTYVDTGLAQSTLYAYTVVAFDYSNNVSSQSQQILVTTLTASQIPPSFVKMSQGQITSGSSVSVSFSSATNAGNTIVAFVIWSNTGSVTLTDTRNNTFIGASAPLSWGSGYRAQIFYATNIAGGTDTVKATFLNSVTSFGVLYVHEYAGISAVNPIDVTRSASGSSGSLNSGAATTTGVNDLIFGAGVSSSVVTAAGSGFAARSFAFGNLTEDKIATSPGSYSATATQNGNAWGMLMVAFRSQ